MLAAEGDGCPLFGYGGDDNSEMCLLALAPLFEPHRHTSGTAARGCKQHAVIVEYGHSAVIKHHACLAKHEAVTRTAGF